MLIELKHAFCLNILFGQVIELMGRYKMKMKWNESGFRPPLCTYRLNWAKRTSWWWWDDWDDTALQTQDSKFEPWRSEAEYATSRSLRLPTMLTFTRGWGRNIFCYFQTAETGNRTPNSGVKGSGANHYLRAPALYGSIYSRQQASDSSRSQSGKDAWTNTTDNAEIVLHKPCKAKAFSIWNHHKCLS